MIIYKTTNLLNGKIYVGQSKYDESSYLGSGVLILKAIQKYGKEHFVKEVLEHCETKGQLDEREEHWIAHLKSNEPGVGYNLSKGGNGNRGYPPSEETRKKLSEALKGRELSNEHRQKIGEAHVGRKHKEESKTKMSQSHTGKILTEEHIENIRKGHTGLKHSEESKRKRSEKLKGKSFLSPEARQKISEAAKRRKPSEETKKKIGDSIRGRKDSEETKRKKSEAMKGKNVGRVAWNKGLKLKKEST